MPVEPTTSESAPGEAVTAVWRRESARIVGALTRVTRDVGLAEDLAQDALVAALEQWPRDGIPSNPAAWLTRTAQRRAIDHFRRTRSLRAKTEQLGHLQKADAMPELDAQVDFIEDDVLRLMFLCCHPSLTPQSRTALTLRLVAGLSTDEISRAFLTSESTMAQRISRAKKTLSASRAEFELPTGRERAARLDDVMAVIYLVFNEGYTATAGDGWMRPELTTEAIRLSRMLSHLAPEEPETHSLQALLEFQASREPARTDGDGQPVLLESQDRSRWDEVLIRRAVTALKRADSLAARGKPVGRYYLQAAIASQHARAASAEETDWPAIARLYDALAEAAPGPVVEVNRAVAHGRAFGPGAGLAVLDALPDGALAGSHLLPSVRGDLLSRAGRAAEASAQFLAAAALTRNERERALLLARARDDHPHRP